MSKKPHKFAWTGVDIDTSLTQADLMAICALVATESTGDLWKGKQRIDEGEVGESWVPYFIKSGLFHHIGAMSFLVEFEVSGGRTTLTTTIGEYMTSQDKIFIFIPFGSKKMIAYHTYMQFVHKLANTVRAADPAASIRVREGVETYERAPVQAPPAQLGQAQPGPVQPDPIQPVQIQAVAPAPQPLLPPPSAAVPVPVPVPTPVQVQVVAPAVPAAPLARPPAPPAPLARPPAPPAPPAVPPTPPVSSESVALEGSADVVVPPTIAPPTESKIDDSTRVVERRPRTVPRWELALPDGRTVPVQTAVIFGRNPSAGDRGDAQLVQISDDSRLVSKTHAVFELVDGHLTVTDLHSSNGTVLIDGPDIEIICEPDVPMKIHARNEVELGDYHIVPRLLPNGEG